MRDSKLNDLIKKYEDKPYLSDETRTLDLMSAMCIKKSQPHIWYGLIQCTKSPLILLAAILATAIFPLLVAGFVAHLREFLIYTVVSIVATASIVNFTLICGIGKSLGLRFNKRWLLGAVIWLIPIEFIPGAKKISWQFLDEIKLEIFIESRMNYIYLFYACLAGKSFAEADRQMYEAIVRDFGNTIDSIGSHSGIPFYLYLFFGFLVWIAMVVFDGQLIDPWMVAYMVFILLSWKSFSHVMLMISMCHWIHGRPGLPDNHPINTTKLPRMTLLVLLVVYVNYIGQIFYLSIFGAPWALG